MTLRELIDKIEEQNDKTLYKNEIYFYQEYDENHAYITKLNALGLFEDKIVLSQNCPLCDN